jgi:carbon monoxide dehydrogenase subunit G
MEFKGTQTIQAPRHIVWAALNDPQTLKLCIDGCESFEAVKDGQWQATVLMSIGPVKARFKGSVTLSDQRENEGYQLTGEGQGGVAGFGKMKAEVKLTDAPGEGPTGTVLDYVAEATVGGKIAQLGSRLVNSVAIKMADAFFTKFNEVVTERSGT